MVLIRAPAIGTWIRPQSAQSRATIPAPAVPIQNWRWQTIMLPHAGTTGSTSIGPPDHTAAGGSSTGLTSAGSGAVTGGPGMLVRAVAAITRARPDARPGRAGTGRPG